MRQALGTSALSQGDQLALISAGGFQEQVILTVGMPGQIESTVFLCLDERCQQEAQVSNSSQHCCGNPPLGRPTQWLLSMLLSVQDQIPQICPLILQSVTLWSISSTHTDGSKLMSSHQAFPSLLLTLPPSRCSPCSSLGAAMFEALVSLKL